VLILIYRTNLLSRFYVNTISFTDLVPAIQPIVRLVIAYALVVGNVRPQSVNNLLNVEDCETIQGIGLYSEATRLQSVNQIW